MDDGATGWQSSPGEVGQGLDGGEASVAYTRVSKWADGMEMRKMAG